MNKEIRDQLDEIYGKIDNLKAEVNELQDEEECKFENLPESLQSAEQGAALETAAEELATAVSSLDEALNSLTSAMEV